MFNANGEAFNLTSGQGVWMSYAEARSETTTLTNNAATTVVDLILNGETISGSITSTDDNAIATYIASLVNQKTSLTGVEAQISSGNQIYFINDNKTGTEEKTKNIKLTKGGTDNTDLASNTVITAYQYTYTSSPINTSHAYDDNTDRKFTTSEDLRSAMQTDARLYVDYSNVVATQGADKNDGVTVIVNEQGQFEISNPVGDALNADDGDITNSTLAVPISITADTLTTQDITFPIGTVIQAGTILSAATTINGAVIPAGATAVAYTLTEAATIPSGSTLEASVGTPMIYPAGTNYRNVNDYSLYISVTGLSNASNNISANSKFMTSMAALQGTLTSGAGIRTSQGVYAASHASSIDVYDSLGSKHTVRFEFSKTGYTTDGGTEWSILISVPEPGDINLGSYPQNIITGSISFNSDGSLATFSPTNITYTANNGSTPNQNIELNFGTLSQFDGMTSFDAASNTSGISQDGYPGGDLAGIRVDETGTLIGSFTNGRRFGLAQVGMARFTNNEGLESDGGNTFIQTSNSGDPIIGQAAVGGRGFIQASSLEMSNVDLSRSLTQLIVIQRGYQANSKTITTADQLLQTLLQLKQ